MKDIEIGQVLSLRIRFNNTGTVSSLRHPYLVVGIDDNIGVVEIAQIDSLAGKEFKAAFISNKTIYYDNPTETVIDKDSYVQLDNTIHIEYFENLSHYRRQKDKLSESKLNDVLEAYNNYHKRYEISEDKQVYMDEQEIDNLNN